MLRDPVAWLRISPYLDQALDLEIDARGPWLSDLARTQPELANTVSDLLSDIEALHARGFLADSPLPATRLDTLMPVLEDMVQRRVAADTPGLVGNGRDIVEGAVLGPYRLVREIGHGGMSSVWLAERIDGQFKREVALKMPFAGPLQARMAERFQREREILATLTHPNIARLYDAGVSGSGQAYLAMEYVSGMPLTHYCDGAALSIRERLRIFLQVLEAVEFAHAQFVLHRDLKPTNILVTQEGRVVLLDFGIAKLLSQEVMPESPLTEMAAHILTPDYASPEQIARSPLGTTSDVYSLGVVLYELVTGIRPFGRSRESHRELEEAILKRDPSRPSQVPFVAEAVLARVSTPRKLAQLLKGDLDTIILKTLKKAPAERYRSVDAFAQDIENYLGSLPVTARPDSAWYRLRRFASRYTWHVTAATVAVLAILFGGATAFWQARSAAHERDRAVALASRDKAINDFTAMLIGEAASSEQPVTVKEMLANSERLALAGTVGNNDDRAAILGTLANLHTAAGDAGKTDQVLQSAIGLLGPSSDAGLRGRLICEHANQLSIMGKIDAGLELGSQELKRLQSDPQNAAVCLESLSHIAQQAGDSKGTLRYATLALERLHESPLKAPADEAIVLGSIAYGHYQQGHHREANHYYELAFQKFTEAGRQRSPDATVILNNWAQVSTASGAPKRALEMYDEVLGRVRQRDPNSRLPPVLVYNKARVLEAIGRYPEARLNYEQGRDLAAQSKDLFYEGGCLLGLASIAEQSGQAALASQYLDEEAQLLGSALAKQGPMRAVRARIQSKLDLAAGRLDEARAQVDLQRAIYAKMGRPSLVAAASTVEVDLLAGDAPAAVTHARAGLAIATFLQGDLAYSNLTGVAWLMLGQALQAHGELEQARKAFESAVAHLSNTVDADHPQLVRARQLLAASVEATAR